MRACLIEITIILISLSLGYAQQENFILFYNFEEGKGDKATDLSEKGNNGNIIDAQWTDDGKFGKGLAFNGKTSFIEVPDDESLDPGGDQITIMAWYKPLSFPAGHPAIARKGQVGAGIGGWGFDTPNGTIRGFVYLAKTGQAAIAQGSSTMAQEEWNHVAMTYDGKEILVYLNGKVDGNIEASGDINTNDGSVWISKKANENIYLDGVMDEIAILNIGLTENEINKYMKEEINLVVKAAGKLATVWSQIKTK